jgi:V/A-type H+/Na+-transporting ATPase subunit D
MSKISPTRVNLLRLKRELKTAEKGHKLLKDKRDGLMREFMRAVHEVKALRKEVNSELIKGFEAYISASALMDPQVIKNAGDPAHETEVDVSVRHVMSVPIPSFTLNQTTVPKLALGYLESYGNMDLALEKLNAVYPRLIALAELESAIERLAREIEQTRRRASALEHIRIPALKASVREIYLRLEEQARDTVVATMRVKALITQ